MVSARLNTAVITDTVIMEKTPPGNSYPPRSPCKWLQGDEADHRHRSHASPLYVSDENNPTKLRDPWTTRSMRRVSSMILNRIT